jgi:hypothetical protein
MAQTVKVVTRATAPTTTPTNPEYGASDTSSNKGSALTSSEMDMNLLNLKDAVEGNSTRMDESHNEDGSLKALSVDGGDLSANSVDYSKIKSIHYAADNGVVNALAFTISGLAALEDGMLFLVKVAVANTAAVTLEVTGASGSLGAKSIYKNKNTALISGDLKAGEMVGVLYDLSNTAFQLLGGGVEDAVALSALASQTTGNLISFASGGGAPVLVAAGSVGEVLTANSSGPPSFQASGMVPLIELTSPTVDTITGDGAQTGDSNGQIWVPPSGVTKVRLCLQGAGGSGYSANGSAGGGGGGGEYTESELAVASSEVYQIYVGAGGPGPTGTDDHASPTAGESTTFKLVTGYGSSAGELTLTAKASAVGGTAGLASTGGGTASGGTQNLKTVSGSAGGAEGVPYPDATAQASAGNYGGHGGVSYKGTPGFAAISNRSDEGKQASGLGYGYGGCGGNGSEGDKTNAEGGGGGWVAIYDIS